MDDVKARLSARIAAKAASRIAPPDPELVRSGKNVATARQHIDEPVTRVGGGIATLDRRLDAPEPPGRPARARAQHQLVRLRPDPNAAHTRGVLHRIRIIPCLTGTDIPFAEAERPRSKQV